MKQCPRPERTKTAYSFVSLPFPLFCPPLPRFLEKFLLLFHFSSFIAFCFFCFVFPTGGLFTGFGGLILHLIFGLTPSVIGCFFSWAVFTAFFTCTPLFVRSYKFVVSLCFGSGVDAVLGRLCPLLFLLFALAAKLFVQQFKVPVRFAEVLFPFESLVLF